MRVCEVLQACLQSYRPLWQSLSASGGGRYQQTKGNVRIEDVTFSSRRWINSDYFVCAETSHQVSVQSEVVNPGASAVHLLPAGQEDNMLLVGGLAELVLHNQAWGVEGTASAPPPTSRRPLYLPTSTLPSVSSPGLPAERRLLLPQLTHILCEFRFLLKSTRLPQVFPDLQIRFRLQSNVHLT